MKQTIKRYIPIQLLSPLLRIRNRILSIAAYGYDRKRYLKSYASGGELDTQENIEAQVIFNTHQIEKGLSHAEFRDGFGIKALRDLKRGMSRLVDHNSTVYIAGLSAIRAYIDKHQDRKYDISLQKDLLGGDLIDEAERCNSQISGSMNIKKSSKRSNRSIDFKTLFENRYTVREYSDKAVDMQTIQEAISIALKTPTVCNRQSFRVLLITDKKKISEALQIQNGFRGYEYPPVLALVLTDSQSFRGITERNNIYIDGGSFMMSFLLGLEYVGLAACPLNTMFSVKEEKETRKLLDIPDNYNFISYVAIGNFRDNNKVAKSFRFPAEKIIIEIN